MSAARAVVDELAMTACLAVQRDFPDARPRARRCPILAETIARAGRQVSLDHPGQGLCRTRPAVGDEASLPARRGFDLVVSALTPQWVQRPAGRAGADKAGDCRPDVALACSPYGGSLAEWRGQLPAAGSELEGGAIARRPASWRCAALGSLLQRAGFASPVADPEQIVVALRFDVSSC